MYIDLLNGTIWS